MKDTTDSSNGQTAKGLCYKVYLPAKLARSYRKHQQVFSGPIALTSEEQLLQQQALSVPYQQHYETTFYEHYWHYKVNSKLKIGNYFYYLKPVSREISPKERMFFRIPISFSIPGLK